MSTSNSNTPMLVRFYDPTIQASDPNGRTLTSILALPDTELEYCHDYIQLLFPLPETSTFHPSAPVIDRATFAAFRSRPELQDQLLKSLTRMLHFYGFEPSWSQDGNPRFEITLGRNFDQASKNWIKRFNHNHLRITRIIRSLRVLGLEKHATLFYRVLTSVYGQHGGSGIGNKSMMFWTRAAVRPLYLAPEDGTDEGQGKDFLYEYEASKEVEANGSAAVQNGNGQAREMTGETDSPA
ncbi:hypothetical protein IMSHALPRED_005003 [Imshaugia aleurites]|uniref:Opioid growth factor receptor (OGFr) conserved domain-containing protein n=1 Tax=Imshaugia aleurites TaxID=172621 RepID=A0A8H3F9W8_9LECA|nr:hypothetical protein IMSHALPRED_005003 [Imshaugia aleurites]